MHDTKERLSPFWIFAFLNYLYADVLARGLLLRVPQRRGFEPDSHRVVLFYNRSQFY